MVTQREEERRRERKAIVGKLLLIVLIALLVCAVLKWAKPAHTCESDSMFYNLSRECPK